jgi:hypothetical protein
MANSLYADKLMDLVGRIGEPLRSTSTTTATNNEPLDLSGIMMMLMMSNMFKKPNANTLPVANTIADLGPMNPQGGFGGNMLAQGGLTQSSIPPVNGDISGIMQLLQSLGPMLGNIGR